MRVINYNGLLTVIIFQKEKKENKQLFYLIYFWIYKEIFFHTDAFA